MVHNNFTPGRPEDPGISRRPSISNQALVGVAEWAYGVTPWFEQGLYLPLYSHSKNDGLTYNGFKLRWLFVKPHAEDSKFFYGVNFEFSVNQKQWDPRHFTSEVRPIIGWHLHPVDIIMNPIMDTAYTGGFKSLDFAPAIRVAYNLLQMGRRRGRVRRLWAVPPDLLGDRAVASDLGGLRSRRQVRQYRNGHRLWPDGGIR